MSIFSKITISILLTSLIVFGGYFAIGYVKLDDITEHSVDSRVIEPSASNIIPKASDNPVEYQRITPDEAQTKMTADAIILDVRTDEEFSAGHIPNAILLPDYGIEAKAADILPDKDKTILVYCRSGRRSEIAAKQLIQMGYTQVYDFGGIVDWAGDIEQ